MRGSGRLLGDSMPKCIRGLKSVECKGHECVACSRAFFCGENHSCTPRPERTETGVIRTPSVGERLSQGFEMIEDDET